MNVVNIHQLLCTVQIQRYTRFAVNKKYKLIQVMGTLYGYISFTAV